MDFVFESISEVEVVDDGSVSCPCDCGCPCVGSPRNDIGSPKKSCSYSMKFPLLLGILSASSGDRWLVDENFLFDWKVGSLCPIFWRDVNKGCVVAATKRQFLLLVLVVAWSSRWCWWVDSDLLRICLDDDLAPLHRILRIIANKKWRNELSKLVILERRQRES